MHLLKGENVDVWSDIYSFGIVLYLMLTGKFPYPFIDYSILNNRDRLEKELEDFHKSDFDFHREFPHKVIISGLSSEVGTLIGHCLAKLPSKRIQNFRYLQRWIEREFSEHKQPFSQQPSEINFYRKGLNLQAINKHSKALEWFNHALTMNPYDPNFWVAAAISLAALGMKEQERTFRNKALQLTKN